MDILNRIGAGAELFIIIALFVIWLKALIDYDGSDRPENEDDDYWDWP